MEGQITYWNLPDAIASGIQMDTEKRVSVVVEKAVKTREV